MENNLKIFIGADHRGFELKNFLVEKLKLHNYEVVDLGAYKFDPEDDYTDIALKVAKAVSKEKNSKGIVICGSGIGVCITANKVKGIRAGFGNDIEIVRKAREDDDINVLALPADFIPQESAWILVEIFLNTRFKGEERYLRRIKKIEKYERLPIYLIFVLFVGLIVLSLLFFFKLFS